MFNIYDIYKRNTNNSTYYGTHLHDTFELNYILTENVEILMEDQIFASKKGSLCIFPPFSPHMIRCKGQVYNRFVLYFNDSLLLQLCGALEPAVSILKKSHPIMISLNQDDADVLEKLFQIAYDDKNSDLPSNDFKKVTILGNILSFIFPLIEQENVSSARNPEINDILNYINYRLKDNITVESIAKHFAMSDTKLRRLIKTHTWLSPKELILNKRLKLAKSLLRSDDVKLDSIPFACGFSDYSYFAQCFKKKFGITPYQYLKQNADEYKIQQ